MSAAPGKRCGGASIGKATVKLGTLLRGGVSERPKERASKAREEQSSEGSNPSATAKRLDSCQPADAVPELGRRS